MLTGVDDLKSLCADVTVDTSDIKGQVVSIEVVDWYVKRFEQALEDECPEVLNAYLEHALNDDRCNTITCSTIISKAYALRNAYTERRQ